MTSRLFIKLAEDLSRLGAGRAGDRGVIHTEKALRDPERSPVDKPVIPPRRPDEVSTQRHEQAILNDQRQIGQVESAPAGDGDDTESVLEDRAVLKNTMTHVTAPDGVDAKPQRNLDEIVSEILTGNRDNSPPQTHANRDVGSQNMDGNYQGSMPGNDVAEPEADGKTMSYIEPPTTKNTATPIPDQVPLSLTAPMPVKQTMIKRAAVMARQMVNNLQTPVPVQRPGTLTPAVSAGDRTEQRPSGAVTHLEPVATRPYAAQPRTQLAPPGYNKGTPSLNGGNAAPAISTGHGVGDAPVRTSDIKNPRLNLPGGAGRIAAGVRRFSKSRIRGYIGGV